MADLTTTQLKLRTTPTAGVASEQSPYYRRLLSAGYKGFLQGTVGGSTLYGVIGAAIGGLVALPLLAVAGPASLALIPAMAGLGLYKGASTFGSIGSFAAITAESAEMNEKRRYLLDRYYDLPDSPEYDEEAKQIRELLSKEHEPKVSHQMFHVRPLIVGALIGGAVALLFTLLAPATIGVVLGHFALGEGLGIAGLAAWSVPIGTALGALSGGVLGLDRYYVRNWMDKTALVMHDTKGIEEQMQEREREIEKLGDHSVRAPLADKAPEANNPRASMKIKVAEPSVSPARDVEESHPGGTRRVPPIDPRQVAGIEHPPTALASSVEHQGRASLDEAMQRPVL